MENGDTIKFLPYKTYAILKNDAIKYLRLSRENLVVQKKTSQDHPTTPRHFKNV